MEEKNIHYAYTSEEMEKVTNIQPQNWCFFEELKNKISTELSKELKKRQKFKDSRINLGLHCNTNLRKGHRPDL